MSRQPILAHSPISASLPPGRHLHPPGHQPRSGNAGQLDGARLLPPEADRRAHALASEERRPGVHGRDAGAGARSRPKTDEDRLLLGRSSPTTAAMAGRAAHRPVPLRARTRRRSCADSSSTAIAAASCNAMAMTSYDKLTSHRPRQRGPWQLVHCWTHVRRRFVKRLQSDGSPIAEEALRQIAELYAIETTVRGLAPALRLAARQDLSAPIVAALRALAGGAALAHPANPRSWPRTSATPSASGPD